MVTVKVAEVAPPATVTVAGTVAAVTLEARLTTKPAAGAMPFNVIVAVEETPPATVVGERLIPVRIGGVTVKVAVKEVAPSFPVMVTEVDEATPVVLTVNVAEVAPASTVTVAGSVALTLLELRLMTAPPGPAGPLSVTLPVEDVPPRTEDGVTVMPARPAGLTVKVADLLVAPNVAEIVTVVAADTAVVLTVKVAELAPAGTVTVTGKVAVALLEERLTTMPPVPAAPVKVTVPVEELPPVTDAGETTTLNTVGGEIVRTAV